MAIAMLMRLAPIFPQRGDGRRHRLRRARTDRSRRLPSARSSASSTSGAISRKPMRSSRNAATATSFAALNVHGYVPPRTPASRASGRSGNRAGSGGSNSSESGAVKSRAGYGGLPALGIGQGIRDRYAHVRVADMRECRAIAEPDEAMYDRTRMHDDVDPLVRNIEQIVSLDQLEALVRKRGRVDRDLRPHGPGGVRESLLHAH